MRITGLILILSLSPAIAQAPGYAGSWHHFDDVYKRLTLSQNAARFLPSNPGAVLHIIGRDIGETVIEGDAFNGDFVLHGFRANGTAENPQALEKDQYITTWVSAGTDGIPETRKDGRKVYQKQGAGISHMTCGKWTEKEHCTDIRFYPRRATDSPDSLFEGVKIGGEEGDTLTVNGSLHTKDRLTATAIDEPDTPPPGKSYIYFDKATKQLSVKDDEGRISRLGNRSHVRAD